jgi:phosphate transport system substrate-binding protein
MNRRFLTTLLSLVIACLVTACARPEPGADSPAGQNQTITVKGSDTMVLLGQRWAENYMKAHPNTTVQVTGGGSGTGIAALINGTTQICQSSRPMKAEEKESLKTQRNSETVEIPVALDALAVFVNESNPVKSLTMEQLSKIYLGEITNWSQVGGKAGNIVMYGRENSSGTYAYFKEHVLANKDFPANYQALPGTAAVINAVTKDSLGIGYGGIGYATGVKLIPIAKDANSPPVEPSEANVHDNSYPISRFLFWYVAGEPAGAVKEFTDWVLSPEGQKVISDVGYYPLKTAGQ